MFTPTYFTPKATDISARFLNQEQFKGIILDIDDTLVPHRHPTPGQAILSWINELKSNNIKIILVSNNFKKRVSSFSQKLEVPYISMGLKPLSYGINKALKLLGIPKQNVLMVGDQIFTDILGANFIKIKSVLVDPAGSNETFILKIKRFFEKPFRKNIKNNCSLSLKEIKLGNVEKGDRL